MTFNVTEFKPSLNSTILSLLPHPLPHRLHHRRHRSRHHQPDQHDFNSHRKSDSVRWRRLPGLIRTHVCIISCRFWDEILYLMCQVECLLINFYILCQAMPHIDTTMEREQRLQWRSKRGIRQIWGRSENDREWDKRKKIWKYSDRTVDYEEQYRMITKALGCP